MEAKLAADAVISHSKKAAFKSSLFGNWMTRDVDFREVEKVMERVAKGFSKDFKAEMKEGREIYEKLKAYGIPVLIRDYTLTYGLGSFVVMEVKKIEKKDLGSQIFLPPTGYQRIIPEIPKK